MSKITFFDTDANEKVEFEVVERTTLNGQNYLLVCEDESGDEVEAYIMKEVSSDSEDVVYEFVEDEIELDAVSNVFAQLLDGDMDIEL